MKIFTSFLDIDIRQWDELVSTSSTASFFQTPGCYRFYDSLSFMTPFVIGVEEKSKLVGVMCGYIIADGGVAKQYFSKRAIVPGGLLLDDSISEQALGVMLSAAKKLLRRKAIYIEIRNYTDYTAQKCTVERFGFNYQAHLNFHVETSDVEKSLKQLSTTKRRDIKLSGKEGAVWCETTDKKEVDDYYEILSDLYRNKIKTPLFPKEFFEKLVMSDFGKLFVVKFNNKVIGGSVCVVLANRTIYEWFVCGMDGVQKNIFPSTLATWAGIEYASKNGFHCFDMMGAGKPDEGYGVREFKSKFGGQLVEHGRFLYVCKPRLYELGKFVVGNRNAQLGKKPNPSATNQAWKIEHDYSKIDIKKWREFVEAHPMGNVFQTPKMYELYLLTPNFSPSIVTVTDAKGDVVGCMLSVIQRDFKGVLGQMTLRSIVMGGPLVLDDNPQLTKVLMEAYIKRTKHRAIFSQIRNLYDVSSLHASLIGLKFEYKEHLDTLIDLTVGVDVLKANLHKERRRNVGIAEKNGLVFRVLTTDSEINELIILLKKTYKRIHIPMSDEKLFYHAQDVLGRKVVFFGAFDGDKMVAGQIRLCYKQLLYAWFAGSDYASLNKKPNDFLTWNVILWAKENDFSQFDFGGAGSPSVAYGVRDYKLKYGGTVVNYGRYELVHNRFLMLLGKISFKMYKKWSGFLNISGS